MRLFIAVNLDESVKCELEKIITSLKPNIKKGSFTLHDNLHLTLIFLGEIAPAKTSIIKQVMQEVQGIPLELSFAGLGYFKRREGNILWMGVNRNEMLRDIYEQLYKKLTRAGFKLETREFKPHLTFGRKIIANQNFDIVSFSQSIPVIKMNVMRISLMKSERINEKLTYTEIYAKNL